MWWLLLVLPSVGGCETTLPSTRLRSDVKLPVPSSASSLPDPDRFFSDEPGEEFRLSARALIPITFSRHPDIKSSYHRLKAEEARYDFFYTSRDSLTPRIRSSNSVGESRIPKSDVSRDRRHLVELSVEKQFFDTTSLNFGLGYEVSAVDEALGSNPLLSANIRYPLWASREKLERTSEEIFWRNQVDDAQLSYIEIVRNRLERTLFQFHETVDLRRRIGVLRTWEIDLRELLARVVAVADRDMTADRERLTAEIAKVGAEVRNASGKFDVEMEKLKAESGLPFHTIIELDNEPFNPFEGFTHKELFRLSIETDPEIATLENAMRNADVQLDLAKRGRWDIALLAGGTSRFDGAGEQDGVSDWTVSFGVDVSAVDSRVTDSLIHQAEATISRFTHSIAARKNEIFVDTFEPLIRIETLSESHDELLGNLPRYQSDFDIGAEEYFAGKLNIDDLLTRRENLFEQQEEIFRLQFLVGANVAELCSATGKFFEILEEFNQ